MKIILTISMILFTTFVCADDWSGTVTTIKSSTTSKAILFQLSGELKNPARCNESKMYAIDLSSPGGEAVFDLIKYAYINKLQVQATSLHTCAVYWEAEGVKEVFLKQ